MEEDDEEQIGSDEEVKDKKEYKKKREELEVKELEKFIKEKHSNFYKIS